MTKHEIDISPSIFWKVLIAGLIIWFLYTIKDVLLLLFVALIIVSAVQPVVDKLESKKIPRPAAAALIYLGFLGLLIGIGFLIVPVISMELKSLADNSANYFQEANKFIEQLNRLAGTYNLQENFQRIINSSADMIANSFSQIFSNTVSLITGIFKSIIVVSLSFYMVVSKNGIQGFVQAIIPERHQAYITNLTLRIQSRIGRWLIGQLSLMAIVFVLYFIGLSLLGVPYALVLAVIGGLLEIIPYFGPIIAFIPALFASLSVSTLLAVGITIFYLIAQQIENHVVTPLVMKRAVGLNPVMVILALLIGGKLGGTLGVIMAVPFATAARVVLDDFVAARDNPAASVNNK